MRLVEEKDVEIKESLQNGAGAGVFAKTRIEEGVILPYFALLKNANEAVNNQDDDTYFMAVTYVKDSKARNIKSLIADGNPRLKATRKLKPEFKATTLVNESSNSPPNCIFVNNSILSKDDIVQAFKKRKLVPITLLVTVRNIEKGEELYSMYGTDYERDYEVWKDTKGIKIDLINKAHDIVDSSRDDLVDIFCNKFGACSM